MSLIKIHRNITFIIIFSHYTFSSQDKTYLKSLVWAVIASNRLLSVQKVYDSKQLKDLYLKFINMYTPFDKNIKTWMSKTIEDPYNEILNTEYLNLD